MKAQKAEIDTINREHEDHVYESITNAKLERDTHFNAIITKYDEQMNMKSFENDNSLITMKTQYAQSSYDMLASINSKHSDEINV